jgi:hypothetical protein
MPIRPSISSAQDSSKRRHSLPYLAVPSHRRNRHGAGAGATCGSCERDGQGTGSVRVGEEDRRVLVGLAGELRGVRGLRAGEIAGSW